MEKFFKLKEHGTDVRTEVTAGLTTFFAMSYILFVNPAMLAQTGMPAHTLKRLVWGLMPSSPTQWFFLWVTLGKRP